MRSIGDMSMSAIRQKFLREVHGLRGQLLSIAVVVATGVMTVVTMRGSYESLVEAQQSYYRSARFADVWSHLKRAPESFREQLARIPGVVDVATRVSLMATLDLPGLDSPAQGLFVSLPERSATELNAVYIRQGRYPVAGARDEVLISEKFAKAHGFRSGDSIAATLNGRQRLLQIVGTAISPEHSYSVPPGALYPDDKRYGVFWMLRRTLGPAYDMDGAFNEVFLQLQADANAAAVIQQLDQHLQAYGGLGAYARKEQISHQILQGELDQNRVMGTAVPAIFLGVAAFLLHLVMGRLIATQRSEIAVLKAFGYRRREIAIHYLSFALLAVGVGAVLGTAGGIALGHTYLELYSKYFNFPQLNYQLRPVLIVFAAGVSVLAAALGALAAVRRAVELPPAEAMRAEPPAGFHAGLVERFKLQAFLSPSARMTVRNLQRKPLQTLLSALGVAFSVAILLVGSVMFDGISYMMDQQFRVMQREDLNLSFVENQALTVRHELSNMAGVTRVETFRSLPVRLRAGHRSKTVAIQSLAADSRLRRIINRSGREQPLPLHGLVINQRLARLLKVAPGDEVQLDVLEGQRGQRQLVVAAVVRDFLGLSVYMHEEALQRLAGGAPVASGAYLLVDEAQRKSLFKQLKNMPGIAAVASPATMLESFETQLADSLLIGIGFLLGFAGVIAVAVIYNGSRIALSERAHELASLRVMGLHRREVAVILFGEQAVVTLLAIPIGWLLGYVLAGLVALSLQTDAYRVPMIVNPTTYIYAGLAVIAAAIASAALVRRRIDSLDLMAVLKNHE